MKKIIKNSFYDFKRLLRLILCLSFLFALSACGEVTVQESTTSDVCTADCSPSNTLCVDDTSGSTQEYSTIQAAVNAAQAGDTVLVCAGTYTENLDWPDTKDNITVKPSGSNFVTIQPADNTAATIIISGDIQGVTFDGLQAGLNSQMLIVGANNPPSNDGQAFRLNRASLPALSGITLKNLRIQGTSTAGRPMINSQPGTDNYVDDLRIENNYIYGNFSRAVELQGTNTGSGTATWRASITGNIIDVSNALYSGPEWSRWDYVFVDSNYIYNTGTSVSYLIQARNSQNSKIQNNVLDNRTGASASAMIIVRGGMGDSAPPNQSSNNTIINNTFDQNGSLDNNGAIILTDVSSNNTVRNNLFIGTYSPQVLGNITGSSGSGNSFDNNRSVASVTWNSSAWTDAGSNTSGSTNYNVNGSKPSPYYDLTASYNGSATDAPTDDYDGIVRASPPDIGAFEY